MRDSSFAARFKLIAIALFAALLVVLPGTALADENQVDELALEEQGTVIDTVYVNGATLYVEDGDKIKFTGTVPAGAPYEIIEERWETDDGSYSSMTPPEELGNFALGDSGKYWVMLRVVDSNYKFADNPKLVLNGKKVSTYPWSGLGVPGSAVSYIYDTENSMVGFWNITTFPTTNYWTRLWGNTALDTTKAISQEGWKKGDTDTVVLATMSGFYDALAAAPLAGTYDAPILLTKKDALSPQALSEIQRLDVDNVIIVGGPAAVSDTVKQELINRGYHVDRVWGPNAQDTAVAIAESAVTELDMPPWSCIVATSKSYHDALAIAPLAWSHRIPVYLTNSKGALSEATLNSLQKYGYEEVIIMGGTSAIPASTETKILDKLGPTSIQRIDGDTAIDTAFKAATFSVDVRGMDYRRMGIATAGDYHDALAGAALCGKNGAVMVLVPKNGAKTPNFAGLDFVENRVSSSNAGYIFGGTAAVSNETKALAEMAVSAPVG